MKGSSIGWAPVLPANIILGWKGLAGANTLAYYENLRIVSVKSITTLGLDVIIIKPFYSPKTQRQNKLECSSIARIIGIV